jgi:hypothetical protein
MESEAVRRPAVGCIVWLGVSLCGERLGDCIAILEKPEPHNEVISNGKSKCSFGADHFAGAIDSCFEVQQGDRILAFANKCADRGPNRSSELAEVADKIRYATTPELPPNPSNSLVAWNKPVNILAKQRRNRGRIGAGAYALKKLSDDFLCVFGSLHARVVA